MYGCQIPGGRGAERLLGGIRCFLTSDTWAVKVRETLANDDRTIKVEEGGRRGGPRGGPSRSSAIYVPPRL